MRFFRRRNSNGSWVWWVSFTARSARGRSVTRRRSTGCATKAAAEVVWSRWERERADPVYAASSTATFGAEARMFLTACEGGVTRGKLAPETLGMYRQKAGVLVRIIGKDRRLAEIDAATFPAYMAERQEEIRSNDGPDAKPIAQSTLYKEWVTFRQILKQAWRAQRYGRDPSSLKPAHFGPEYTPRETFLTWEQVGSLLETLADEREAPVRFALATGARRREVFAARPGDLDTSAWTVLIRGTKTEASAATIPIPQPMRKLLIGVRHELPFAKWQNARRGLARACVRAGVPVVTWNDLRRTFASLLIQAGVAPHIVARLLRHKSTAMVDKVYGRATHEDLAKLLDAQLREPPVNHTRARRAAKRGKRR